MSVRRLLTAVALALAAFLLAPSLVRPRRYVLEREVVIPAPLPQAFAFFEEPANLARVTPAWMGFRIVNVEGLPVRAGTTIEYRIRPLGVPQRWVARIAEYDPERRFVDVQERGPYRYWRHEHAFEPRDGMTIMRDSVEYELPLGILGGIANTMLVARQLQAIFDYRALAIARIFAQ